MSTVVGNIYRQTGEISVTDEGIVQVGMTEMPNDHEQQGEIIETVRRINETLRRGVVTTLRQDRYVLSKPPSNDDLDAIADYIAITTHGAMVGTHSCPSLDAEPDESLRMG